MPTRSAIFFIALTAFSFSAPPQANSADDELQQKVFELNTRVRELEDYIDTIQRTLNKNQQDIATNFTSLQQGLQANLQNFADHLQFNLDQRLQGVNDRVAVLDILSKEYRKIDTNSGYFLIGIKKFEPIKGGYKLTFHIGNPNFGNYSGLKLKVLWGKKFDSDNLKDYEAWRNSLTGAAYTSTLRLNAGTWNELHVDIPVNSPKNLEYMECSLDVTSIELDLKKPE